MSLPSFALVTRHGASKVTSAIWQYGMPPSLSALKGLLEEQEKAQRWQAYMADALCHVIKMLNPKSKMPYYTDLDKSGRNTDSRSGREILEDVKNRLKQRRAARGGE